MISGALAAALAEGANANARDGSERWTALHYAIEHDHPGVLRALIAAGADVNAAASKGWTPLHHAVGAEADFDNQNGRAADLRRISPLLAAGADPTAESLAHGRVKPPIEIARGYSYSRAVDAMSTALLR